MALPLPQVVADVGPGGPLVTSMGGINSLANNMLLRQMNQIKKQYLPTTMQAEAASKLAYANLMGPQFLAKLLQNPGAIANMGDPAARAALQKAVGAGMGQGTGLNSLNSMPAPNAVDQAGANTFSGKLKNVFMGLIGHQPSQVNNPFSQTTQATYQGAPPPNQNSMSPNGSSTPRSSARPKNGVSLEGQQWYDKNGNPVYQDDTKYSGQTPMEMELTNGQREVSEPTWAEKTGKNLGTIKQGEESGKYRAEALKDIGNSQLALSGSKAAQDELIKIIQNPVWQHARDKIPAFQKQQLSLLKVTGSPELRKLAGEYISAGQAMVANQVAGMGNKHLVREYDLAEKQKINDSDTIESSEGKITNAKNLHDIAEQKNNIIKNLLKQGVDEADAVETANKKVDVSAIRRATDKLLERKISVTNNKTGETRIMSVKEAKKLGVPNV